MTRNDLSRIISTQIPLTKAMGLKVSAASVEKGVTLALPLKPNRNHKKTAFGGTLVAGQALASWAWLMVALDHHGVPAEVVVQRQSSEFLRPVAKNFSIRTEPVPRETLQRFLYVLERRGKARIEISARVIVEGRTTTTYKGQYVAILNERIRSRHNSKRS